MSNFAMTDWVWKQNLPPQRKLVLLKLACRADKDGLCWPRLRLIAEECSMSTRTVQRHLRCLEAGKIVSVEKRYRPDGSQSSNGYLLLAPPPSEHVETVTPPVTTETRACDITVSALEPSLNHVENKQLLEPELIDWPRAVLHDRDELMRMLRGVDLNSAQQLIDELAGALATDAIKSSPVRWFRSVVRSFRNGNFRPSAGLSVQRQRQTVPISKPDVVRAKTAGSVSKSDPKIARENLDAMKQLTKPK